MALIGLFNNVMVFEQIPESSLEGIRLETSAHHVMIIFSTRTIYGTDNSIPIHQQ
jgi:hypothetical protein